MPGPATYTQNPADSVKRSFSSKTTKTEPTGSVSPQDEILMPEVDKSDLAPGLIPKPAVTSEDIAKFFAPLVAQIEQEQAPAPHPLPPGISPMGAFLGTLAGNLASVFGQNPMFAAQAQKILQDNEQRRQVIEDQNYAEQLTFSAEKRNRLTAVRGQLLEKQLDLAIKNGDDERALAISKELGKFQEGLRRESDAQAAEREQQLIRTRGQEERKTAKVTEEIKKTEEAKQANKPLTAKEYLQAINDVNKNKNIPNEYRRRTGAILGPGFFGELVGGRQVEPTSREEGLERIHASALLGGDPGVRQAAWRNLKLAIRKRLGVPTTGTLNQEQRKAFESELTRYGLELGGLEP